MDTCLMSLTADFAFDLHSGLRWGKSTVPCLCPVTHHPRCAGQLYSLEKGKVLGVMGKRQPFATACQNLIAIWTKMVDSVGRVAQSVQRLPTGWTVRGSNPGGGEIFRTCPDRPWFPPSLLYNGYWVFPGVRCGRGGPLTLHPLLVPKSKIE